MTSTVQYATVAEVKAQPDILGSQSDAVLTALIDAASRMVDGICNRSTDGFVANPVPSARSFVGRGEAYCYIDEALSISMVELKSSRSDAWQAISVDNWLGFVGDPENPTFNQAPYNGVTLIGDDLISFADGRSAPGVPPVPTCRVTATWGYSLTTPPMVKQATIIIVSRWLKRGQSSWADAAASSDFGQMMFVKQIDPEVEQMLLKSRLGRPTYG